MRSPRTFVLGLGCQKGGTTWLSRYLASSPQFEGGFAKEYHVFDYLDLGVKVAKNPIELARRDLDLVATGQPAKARHLLWSGFCADPETYFDYFAGLLSRDGIRASADLTPTYAGLSVDRLTHIKDEFAARGVRTVGVFLMRDPVERMWSSVRMHQARDSSGRAATADERVRREYRSRVQEIRSRYDRTLTAVDSVFGADDLYVEFYERLFDETRVKQLTDLIGLDFHAPDLETKVYSTAKKEPLEPETVRLVANHFRPVYEAVSRRFPDVDLEELWPSTKLLGSQS